MLLSKSELVLESRLAVISTIEPSILTTTAGPTRRAASEVAATLRYLRSFEVLLLRQQQL